MNPDPNAPAAQMPFPPGTVIAGGKYRVSRLLGEGGMGWVVVATHLQLEQRVALKFMRSAKNPEAVARFLREARAAARIQSEHVARVSDVGTLENGSPYLVMEYLEGEDLSELIDAKGALPEYLAVDYAMQACEGLAEAHAAGIIHRDLKPANLFLARRTDGSVRVKLLDFGISKLTPAPGSQPEIHMTSTQALMGSPLYMAPEQMRSSRSVDRRADIWSMGTIIYEMLTGRSPFEGTTLPEVCAKILADTPTPMASLQPDLPPELDAVVLRCLEKSPDKRYPDVAALAHALGAFGTDEIRSTAERIGRVRRVHVAPRAEKFDDAPAPSQDLDLESAAITNPLARQAAERESVETQVAKTALVATSASFTRGSNPLIKRRPTLPLVVAGGGLAGALVLAIVFVAMRGPPAQPAATSGSVTSSATRAPASESMNVPTAAAAPPALPPASTATPGWTAAPNAAPAPTTTAPPTVLPASLPVATLTPAPPARTVAPRATTPAAAPVAAPKPSAAPAPAATSSFGGRD
jgi:eukaryotic-like serine/threonine-protein kinase